jgi:hypothetical protein
VFILYFSEGSNLRSLCGGDGLASALGGALSGLLDLGPGDDQRQADRVVSKALENCQYGLCVYLRQRSEYRVGGDVNALLLGVVDQRRVGEVWVTLNLVDCGHDTGGIDDCLELEGRIC